VAFSWHFLVELLPRKHIQSDRHLLMLAYKKKKTSRQAVAMVSTGAQATFVISWAQTEIGGLPAGPVHGLVPGAMWRWAGPAVRLDGPEGPLILGAEALAALRDRAARTVRRMLGHDGPLRALAEPESPDPPDQGFVVTDGARRYPVSLVHSRDTGARLVLFTGELPPRDRPLRITRTRIDPKAGLERAGGVICFTPGTRLMTPSGARPIMALQPGDLVQTRDDGAQPVVWVGQCQLSEAQLLARPHLRPVRIGRGAIGAAAFGIGQPDGALVVSPQHRMLVTGAAVSALFNDAEALVAAEDLINGSSVAVDLSPGGAQYVHILLERHSIVFANGVATESFHPAGMALETLAQADMARLVAHLPGVIGDPEGYGPFARRSLSGAEAAILKHEFAG
jgi:Hint domain